MRWRFGVKTRQRRPAPELRSAAMEAAGAQGSNVLDDADVGRRVVRGGALRVAGFVAVNVLGAIGSGFLLRPLGVVDFGRYGTVLALVTIVGVVADAGMTVTGMRELSLRPPGQDRARLVGTIAAIRVALTAIGVVASFVFALLVGYDHVMVIGVLLAGAGAVVLAAQVSYTLPLGVELLNGRLAVTEVIRQALLVGGIVALALAGAELGAFYALQIAVGFGALGTTILLVGHRRIGVPSFHWHDWKELAIKAFPVPVASVVLTIYQRVLIVLASVLTTAFQSGLFVASSRIVEMAAGLALLLG